MSAGKDTECILEGGRSAQPSYTGSGSLILQLKTANRV